MYGGIKRFVHVSTDEVYGAGEEFDASDVVGVIGGGNSCSSGDGGGGDGDGSRGEDGSSNDDGMNSQSSDNSVSSGNSPGHSEAALLQPTNPYAATKAAAEMLVGAYRMSFGLDTIITRGNNVFGPKQFPEKLIPKLCLQLHRGRPCTIHGDGSNRRDYLYVTDVARALSVVMRKGSPGQVYNIGGGGSVGGEAGASSSEGGDDKRNVEVARELIALFGFSSREKELLQYVPDRKFNDRRYKIDSSKLRALGWRPRVGWSEGLRLTKEWYTADGNAGHWSGKKRSRRDGAAMEGRKRKCSDSSVEKKEPGGDGGHVDDDVDGGGGGGEEDDYVEMALAAHPRIAE